MSIFWKTYAILFSFICMGRISSLLDPNSNENIFYNLLIQFYPLSSIYFSLNIGLLIVSYISSIAIIAYAFKYNVKWLQSPFLFMLRIIFEACGHYYEFQTIKSSFFHSQFFGFASLFVFAIPLIPSYLAHWRYISKNP